MVRVAVLAFQTEKLQWIKYKETKRSEVGSQKSEDNSS